MTRESWHDGTYSHEWGTSAIVGTTIGIMGVHQTSPGFATFAVKPKLGSLAHATITVPTVRGPINVTAAPGVVDANIPCNAKATLCLPKAAADKGVLRTPQSHVLLLDGAEVTSSLTAGGHLCVMQPVGCGAAGGARQLRARPRM
jgi:hypothetical protein